HLNLTTNGLERMIRDFKSLNLPWVALGGGGYNPSNVARGWTLAWAIMNGIELPDSIPDSFIDMGKGYGITEENLRDKPFWLDPGERERIWKEVEGDIEFLRGLRSSG
ncbi:MAG: acetoin utilization protein AcuC, partial [Deltaproteobacteria bacterium]|nr:acetoin utilization protein AcuC [Deltaproteobacteria bacterium]